LSARRGAKRAAVAVAHSILVIAYHLILRNTPYSELGADYFERHEKPHLKKKRLITQLEKLGYQVNLTEIATAS
jgi:hypothetical protein